MRHPQVSRDVSAFSTDLRRTGQIEPARADSIARIAVREAYHRRIPPALVLGVMLTENDGFKRNARSNVGALGLMQVMPRIWIPNLGPILGRNLRDDETNLRYGVYILKHFAKRTADTLDAKDVTRTALLVLLRFWPPGPGPRNASQRQSRRSASSVQARRSAAAGRVIESPDRCKRSRADR